MYILGCRGIQDTTTPKLAYAGVNASRHINHVFILRQIGYRNAEDRRMN